MCHCNSIVSVWEKPNLPLAEMSVYFLTGTLCSLNFPALSIRMPIKPRHGKSTIYNPLYRFYLLIAILFTFTQRSTALLKTPCVRHVTHNLESFEEKQPVFGGSKGQGAASIQPICPQTDRCRRPPPLPALEKGLAG